MAIHRLSVRYSPSGRSSHWFKVAVYDTATELQAAANKHRPGDPNSWANCAGCFQPSDRSTSYLGIMRLCRERLDHDTIIHESVHAAITYTWKSLGLKVIHLNPYSQTSMAEREEVMAHAVNGIACALLKHFGLT